MKHIFKLITLFFVFTAASCTPINMAVVNAPTYLDRISPTKDIAFGPQEWQRLDIYKPSAIAKNRTLPVIVFYYGGRWQDGSKDLYKFVGSALAKENYIVVIPDYRKYPEVKFPVFVEDAAKSLSWVYDNIERYGGDKNSIHVSGHSAGAHIGALLTADARYMKREGKNRSKIIKDFVGLAGPYDFIPHEPDLQDMFGPPEKYPQMQVTTFIDGKQPPMLLLWGEQDQYVGRFNMEKLEKRIKNKGGCVKSKVYAGLDHIWLLGDLSWIGNNKYGVMEDWITYLNKKICP